MTQTTIRKWGNSPSVRIPSAIMQSASLSVNDMVNIDIQDGNIIITPIKTKEYSLDSLLADITDENIHEKVDFGAPVGKELL